jgi:hypothetical protein
MWILISCMVFSGYFFSSLALRKPSTASKNSFGVFQAVGAVDLADDLVENGYKIVVHMAAPFRIGGFGSQHLDKWRGILVGFFARGRLKYFVVPHRQLIVEFAQLGGFVFILILADTVRLRLLPLSLKICNFQLVRLI